ncbi:Uncharacterised protein [Mycobacterium tuberculosis]|nr:Uncharacterised protein [Mycobacterium tuberculosis]
MLADSTVVDEIESRSPMYAPAQNARPVPVITMTRTLLSASAASTRRKNADVIGPPHAFSRAGWLRVITATPESRTS